MKWKGVLDYKIIIGILIYIIAIYNILNSIGISLLYIIYFIAISFIPIFGIYLTIRNEDNVIDFLGNIIKYVFRPKIYVFKYKNNIDSYTLYKTRRLLVVKRNNKWYNLKSILKD